MIPFAAGMLAFDLTPSVHHTGDGITGALRWLGMVGACAFYALTIWSYLRRGPAVATCRSVTAHMAAVVATFTPFVFPLLRYRRRALAGSSPRLARAGRRDLVRLVAATSSAATCR